MRYDAHPRYGGNLQRFSWPQFLFRSCAGWILISISIFFIISSWMSGDIFFTNPKALISLGAQDPVKLVQGEYWRFLTPMLLHGGLIHFLFNAYAISYVGRDLEPVLGSKYFLLIFVLSGFAGSISSAVFSTVLSVGASGAIFGLLGAGLYIEYAVAKLIKTSTGVKPKVGPYMMLLLINIPLSFLPMIDSSAHFGGLLSGFMLTYILTKMRPSRLNKQNKIVGSMVLILYTAILSFGFMLGTDRSFVKERLLLKYKEETHVPQQIILLNQIMELDSDEVE
ncbi:MAG: rhomboid family intramembrane serine protease [Oligoflexales bacterium]|nr:rhomboid family intramembrane serine protease [Oligoflexales bacterium]